MTRIVFLLLAIGLWTSGCAPVALVDRGSVDLDLTPLEVSSIESLPEGRVNWGGRIIRMEASGESTELEILGFPLKTSGIPDTDRASAGRFIALHQGFIDPLVYHKNKVVTMVGTLSGIRQGTIDGQDYRWPILRIEEMAPVTEQRSRGVVPFFSIGIGIGL
jgi:outer membrane lipoprotein